MTLEVGKILRPSGIRGEVKILPLTDDVSRFKDLKYLIVKGQEKTVLSLRISEGYVYAYLEGVTDRNLAEGLRDEFVSVKRKDAVKLPEDKHFIVDLIGCKVYAGDELIGEVTNVLQYTATDIYEIKCKKGTALFPIVPDLIMNTDTDKKRIDVEAKRLSEVIVYED